MLSRRPVFWIVAVLLSLAGVFYSVKHFSDAFPILSVDLKMDRAGALRQGKEIAERLQLGPQGIRDVREMAAFNADSDVQNYVELEAGGKPAFRAMVEGDLYSPFQWIVRFCREGEKREAQLAFTPQGTPYGFEETLPETDPGAALDEKAALAIAQTRAAADWGVSFEGYNPPRASQLTRPSGRVDHTFVFERPQKIGEGRYQLTLGVSGDRLTQVSHSVEVPEAFARRYAQMRSANETIWWADRIAVIGLYGIGGCCVGLFFLLRERRVLWRGALAAGLLVSVLQSLAALNEMPLTWMGYDTALSVRTFALVKIVVPLLQNFLTDFLIFSLSFIAAESLTRRAFPDHLQVWKIWTSDVAASPQVLGRTLGGYLVVGVDVAFVVAFYIFTARHFHWWSPSEMLIDPNLPSTYLPWFSPIANALQAGSWEESLFRAVPLAGAALIGQRLGCRRTAIAVAFVLQAVLFGAGHANYPVQPAYARLVELIVPASVFGFLYLRYGLLPAIIAHFFYDVVMMSLSLLASSLPGVWIDRTLLVLVALLPLWIALAARWRAASRFGRAPEVSPAAWNAAWHPPAAPDDGGEGTLETGISLPPKRIGAWGLAGIAGLALWLAFAGFENAVPPLRVTRAEAEHTARAKVEAYEAQAQAPIGKAAAGPWTVLSGVSATRGDDDAFAWRSGKPADYQVLLNRFLDPPFWQVRFVHFTGDVAQRAEEYRVRLARGGEIVGFDHLLPEARPGASLAAAAAKAKADAAIQAWFGVDPAGLRAVGSDSKQQPNRVDWRFTYSDPDAERYPLLSGQGRYTVSLRGDEVGGVRGYLFVPDAWQRQEEGRKAPLVAFQGLCKYVLLVAMAVALAAAVVAWSRARFSVSAFVLFSCGVFGLKIVELWNQWPSLAAGFSTSEPPLNQAFQAVGGELLHAFFAALSIGAAAGYFQAFRKEGAPRSFAKEAAVAVGIALGWIGVRALSGALPETAALNPPWASYVELGNRLPWLAAATERIVDILYTIAEFFWLLRLADLAAARWPALGRRGAFAPGAAIVLGLLVYLGAGGIETFCSWLFSALSAGLVLTTGYWTFLRFRRAWLPLVFGIVGALFGAAKQGVLLAYPGAWGNWLGAVLLIAIGGYWSWSLASASREFPWKDPRFR